MKKYLLDTDICIYYIKGQFGLNEKFVQADPENCYISEITLAELEFGVENSDKKEKNQKALDDFLSGIKLIPIFHSLDFYAKEKARLKRTGKIIDDFDLESRSYSR
ncbi:MAG: PIN domain-containing protein [Candidatus Delongbacteria bacterium]|nr:PIN domain-containing protein [Candidatus Delongbacteria bacterium]